jgi:outer membrane receptor for ferrienterochelin and colicin
MKQFITGLLLLLTTHLYGQSASAQLPLPVRITLNLRNVSLPEVFSQIEKQSEYRFTYINEQMRTIRLAQFKVTNARIEEVLPQLSQLTATQYALSGTNISVALIRSSDPASTETGSLAGRVTDKSTGEALPGAVVRNPVGGQGAAADVQGNYRLDKLPEGTLSIEVTYVGYKPYTGQVTIVAGQTAVLDIKLASDNTLQEVTVEARRQSSTETQVLLERKNATEISDRLSARQIERTASITTAQALQKVTGVSVRDGKYVSIRGMGDRNVVIQLNGARLSSSDPSRTSVPIDLIPAQLLENINVQKSVLPDKPGDATAGIVELKTRSIPDSLIVSATGQLGFNDQVGLGGTYTGFQGSQLGVFGQKINDLKLTSEFQALQGQYPNGFNNVFVQSRSDVAGYTEAVRVNDLMEQLDPVFAVSPQKAVPNQLYALTAGNRYKIGNVKIGVVAGLNYYRRTTQQEEENNRYRNNPLYVTPSRINPVTLFTSRGAIGTESIQYGAIVGLTVTPSRNHDISFQYIPTRNTEASGTSLGARINKRTTVAITSPDPYVPDVNRGIYLTYLYPSSGLPLDTNTTNPDTYLYQLQATQRTFSTFQARGEHKLVRTGNDHIRFSWSYSSSLSDQQDPDFRNVERTALNVQRFFRTSREENINALADLTVPVQIKSLKITTKIGAFLLRRNRDYTERFFNLTAANLYLTNPGPDQLAALASPRNTGIREGDNSFEGQPLLWGVIYSPLATGNDYNMKQYVTSFYAMTDLELGPRLRLAGGMRIEDTQATGQRDTTGADFSNIITETQYRKAFIVGQKEYQWLPSGTFIYRPNGRMNVRASASRTLGRPEIRELVPISVFDAIQAATIVGNNELRNATYINADLRWEWFLKNEEVIAVSAFYKRAENVIERTFTQGTGSRFYTGVLSQTLGTISFRNSPNAGFVYGVELEYRAGLERIWKRLNNFYAGVNLFLGKSQTTLSREEYTALLTFDRKAKDTRPLFEQPGYIVNATLGYDDEDRGITSTLILNKVGERLVEINSDGTPNVFEQPATELDFVLNKKIIGGLQVRFFGKNLLNRYTEWIYKNAGVSDAYGTDQQTYYRRRFRTGREFSFGFTYTF